MVDPSSIPWMVIVGWMSLASLVAFGAHGLDKRAAIRGRRRVPEARLHGLELVGGWPGAIVGMLVFRHKIRKASYLVVTGLIVAAWIAVGLGLGLDLLNDVVD